VVVCSCCLVEGGVGPPHGWWSLMYIETALPALGCGHSCHLVPYHLFSFPTNLSASACPPTTNSTTIPTPAAHIITTTTLNPNMSTRFCLDSFTAAWWERATWCATWSCSPTVWHMNSHRSWSFPLPSATWLLTCVMGCGCSRWQRRSQVCVVMYRGAAAWDV
jgi:hypothetical protein